MASIDEPSGTVPPLNLEAVRTARHIAVEIRTNGHRSAQYVIDGWALVDLLDVYDNLAARHAMLAAEHAEVSAQVKALGL